MEIYMDATLTYLLEHDKARVDKLLEIGKLRYCGDKVYLITKNK